MSHVDKRGGFTLIELMLAMSFISVLLIAIALTIIQISNIYNRGITLKEVNQAGRSVASELQRSIAENAPFAIEPGVGSHYVSQAWGGRLCIGHFTYIWNYGKAIDENEASRLNVYSNGEDAIRFVKISDPSATYCSEASKKVDQSKAIELLDVGEHNLALHSFSISSEPTASNSRIGQRLYGIDFLLGTNDQAALTFTSGLASCRSPGEAQADPVYCSVNQFSLTARAGNAIE